MILSLNEYHSLLRSDFYAFAEAAFYELNPTADFLPNWHLEEIASALEECRQGKITRLIINVPPRSLKSHSASIAFPAFVLGHDPTAQIISVSYGQDLANKLAWECRRLMSGPFYQSLFPETRLSPDRQVLQEFTTTKFGFRFSASMGGTLTGRGADFIIIDDPLTPEEALLEAQRNAANRFFDHTLYSRLNDKRTGCIILVMQRLHEHDLVGHVLKTEDWKVLRFPAIAEEDEFHEIHTPYGTKHVFRKKGEALHPEREPLEVLKRIRETQGEYTFAGQYQQAPAPLLPGMLKAKTPSEEFEVIVVYDETRNEPALQQPQISPPLFLSPTE